MSNAPANQAPEDGLKSYQFGLDLGGTVAGFFESVSGVGSESEVIIRKITDQRGNDIIRKIPGRLNFTDITLTKGVTMNLDIWAWRSQVEKGDIDDARKNGSILMYASDGSVAAQWDFYNAWPSKVTGPEMKTDSNDIGIETMVLVHEGIERVEV